MDILYIVKLFPLKQQSLHKRKLKTITNQLI